MARCSDFLKLESLLHECSWLVQLNAADAVVASARRCAPDFSRAFNLASAAVA
eukprot:CAMPEP_0115170336 /NCGR_PEP_ID=MMETSP0270-20121206/1732_1 /TAXON_ID=71861 /ORGANISM="Scrippsiella trochoidea, Strain CCMP3099" /LENGTH=52 /DNA_ID=CAMNT_0002583063 /DNA_START=579 /DNA_END=734 /DNA_ORIENTATION=+